VLYFRTSLPCPRNFFLFYDHVGDDKKYFHLNIGNEIPIYRDNPRKITLYGQVSQGLPDQNFRRKYLVPKRVIVPNSHCIRNVELAL
jgi:hypothetical protein